MRRCTIELGVHTLLSLFFSELGDALSPRREPGDEGSF